MKMFINKTNIKLLAAALLTALAAPSCMNLDETREGGYGYLTISGLDLDVQVEQLVPTKAVELPTIETPDLTQVVYKVTDKNGDTYQSNTATWTNPLSIPIGNYKIEAWIGSNGFDGPYFYGSKEDQLRGESKEDGVTLSVANTLVAVSVSDELKGHFSPNTGNCVKVSLNNTTYRETTLDKYLFVPAGENLTITVAGKNAVGADKSFVYDFNPQGSSGKAYNVVASAHGVLTSEQICFGNQIVVVTPPAFMAGTNLDNLIYQAIDADETNWATNFCSMF